MRRIKKFNEKFDDKIRKRLSGDYKQEEWVEMDSKDLEDFKNRDLDNPGAQGSSLWHEKGQKSVKSDKLNFDIPDDLYHDDEDEDWDDEDEDWDDEDEDWDDEDEDWDDEVETSDETSPISKQELLDELDMALTNKDWSRVEKVHKLLKQFFNW